MNTAQWPQEIVVKPIEEIIPNTFTKQQQQHHHHHHQQQMQQQQQPATGAAAAAALERKTRPQKEQALNCPRCNSTNTKFCYYNNYSLSQPRYFCKTCRRYWTEGGSLRNIPVGGGCRKNKRSSSSSSSLSPSPSSIASSKKLSDFVVLPQNSSASAQINNSKPHEGQDLNLAFPSTHQDFRSISEFVQVPNIDNSNKNHHIPSSSPTTSATTNSHHLSALELLTGITASRGFSSFMPMPIPDNMNAVYTSGYHHMQDFKPTLNFTLDHGYGDLQAGVQETNASSRVLFPFEDLKQVSSTTSHDVEQINRGHADSTGYWTGMLGGGSW